MVAVESDVARAITGNRCAVVEAVSSSVVLGVLGNRADSACVKTDDLNGAAVCKGVFSGRCSVCAYSNRCRITRYVICDDGICTRVSAGDVEREVESLVLITLITGDSLAEIEVILCNAVGIARAFNSGVLYICSACVDVSCGITENIAVNAKLVVSVCNNKYIQITGRV